MNTQNNVCRLESMQATIDKTSDESKLMEISISDFARWLDGRSYGYEITQEEERIAKERGFVVVFGYSDDNAELRGAINDELDCFDGGILKHKDLPGIIRAVWCDEDAIAPWTYQTTIPHAEFRIYDGGDLYCVGIVCDTNTSYDQPRFVDVNQIRRKSIADPESGEAIVYLQDIDEIPVADVVEVVRCEDCTQWVEGRHHTGRCNALIGFHGADRYTTGHDHFCSYGEMRSDGNL